LEGRVTNELNAGAKSKAFRGNSDFPIAHFLKGRRQKAPENQKLIDKKKTQKQYLKGGIVSLPVLTCGQEKNRLSLKKMFPDKINRKGEQEGEGGGHWGGQRVCRPKRYVMQRHKMVVFNTGSTKGFLLNKDGKSIPRKESLKGKRGELKTTLFLKGLQSETFVWYELVKTSGPTARTLVLGGAKGGGGQPNCLETQNITQTSATDQ